MVQHRFDHFAKAVANDPSSRRKLLAALTLGVIGGGALVPLESSAQVDGERCDVRCKKGCCPKRHPKCCNKYKLCCPKKAKYCARDGCYR